MRTGEAVRCFATVLAVSVPLSVAMFAMLSTPQAAPQAGHDDGGNAVAAMTSTALSLLHEFDATVMVLAWNLGVAALLVGLQCAFGRRVLSRIELAAARR